MHCSFKKESIVDKQIKKLYIAETVLGGNLKGKAKKYSTSYITKFIHRIVGRRVKVVFPKDGDAYYRRNTIGIPVSWACSKPVALHEIAHYYTGPTHGPVFALVLLFLVGLFLGSKQQGRLIRSYLRHRVSFLPSIKRLGR